jgi:GxxExxY protein
MANTRKKLLHEEICDLVLKAFFQVHYELGPGFPESVYAAAMMLVLTDLGLRVEREIPIAVFFRGMRIGSFRADTIVESVVLLEYKSMRRPHRKFEAQILGYLRSTRLEVGLLLYFNPKATFKRIVFSNDRKLLPDLIP